MAERDNTDYGAQGYDQIKSKIIDNDFHPIDSDMSATNDHWGTVISETSTVNRSSKSDKADKTGNSDRYGGADLPTSPRGSNERTFYNNRGDK